MAKPLTLILGMGLALSPLAGKVLAGSGDIVATNSNTGFANFSAPSGQHITRLNGYWSGGWGYITAYASGGSSGDIMATRDVAIFLSDLTVPPSRHITRMGPDGSTYLGVWTEAGLLGDVIYNSGSSSTWTFTNFTAPPGEVVTGFTSRSGGGWAYLTAVSSGISGVEEAEVGSRASEVQFPAAPNPFASWATIPGHERESFALYDLSGRKVGTYRGDRIGEGLRAGLYFLRPEGLDAKPLRVVKVR